MIPHARATQSRLRTLLSYVSPFRSARKPADATTPAIESRPNNDGRGGEVAASTATESDDRDADAPQVSGRIVAAACRRFTDVLELGLVERRFAQRQHPVGAAAERREPRQCDRRPRAFLSGQGTRRRRAAHPNRARRRSPTLAAR